MKRTLKKLGGLLLMLSLVLSLLPVTALAALAPTYTVGTAEELTTALAAVSSTAAIQLQNSITYNLNITVDNKTIYFDLDGFTLDVEVASGTALSVINGGNVSLLGSGALNVTSHNGNGVWVEQSDTLVGSSATVTNATGTGTDKVGGFAGYNCSLTVNGNVVTSGASSKGLQTSAGAGPATVAVHGNVAASGENSCGVYTSGGNITIDGNVTADGLNCSGVVSSYLDIHVKGNVTATGTGSIGAVLPAGESYNTITIDGVITAETYLSVSDTAMTADQGVDGTVNSLTYLIYSITDATSAVRVFKPLQLTVGTGGGYAHLTDALAAANDGDTVKLLNNITESVSYTNAGKTITIDGNNKTITGETGTSSSTNALKLFGQGSIKLINLTLQGGAATEQSVGLEVINSINVQSEGIVIANGGAVAPNPDPDAVNASFGLQVSSSGTVNITEAHGGAAASSAGVLMNSAGTVNVTAATGQMGTATSVGVLCMSGTVNVTKATGGTSDSTSRGYGVMNNSGTVNVSEASGSSIGTSYGVYNLAGKVNVTAATAVSAMPMGSYGAFNESTGTINGGTITGDTGGAGTINTGADVATLTLIKGAGASCVLDSITVAASGETTIGTLPSVVKAGEYSGDWFTGAPVSQANYFGDKTVNGATTLYSLFYTVPAVISGGGGTTIQTPNTTTVTVGGTTTATTTAAAATTSSGGAEAAVTGTQLNDAISKAVSGAAAQGAGAAAIVEIKVEGASASTSVTTSIPWAAFSELAGSSADGLSISTPVASITFDGAALDEINGKATGDVKITAALADTSSLPAAVQQQVGSRPVYSFTVTSNGQTVSDFGGGSATVSLPYTLRAGENPNAVVVYYIDASGTLQTMQGAYDAATGTVSFVTSHFSEYMIGYNKVTFTDVAGDIWYADAVTFIAARGVTSGTTSTTFSPDMTLTRGQFITMLLRAYGILADAKPTDNFTDAGNTYYTGYLAAAKRLGITSGIGDNRFAPEQVITRQEMFTLLYNALKTLNQLPSGSSGKTLADFTDMTSVAVWAKDAMTLLVETGTVSGSGGKLSPADTTTRAQMAQVLYSMLAK